MGSTCAAIRTGHAGEHCDIVIENDGDGHHRASLVDHSSNGTGLNSTRVHKESVELAEGAELSFPFVEPGNGSAPVRFLFRWLEQPSTPAPNPALGIVAPSGLEADYTLEKILGRGAHAVVWRATHKRTSRVVAIKTISKVQWTLQTGRGADALLTEVEILRRCRHARVVRLYDVLDTEKDLHLILEYLDGGSLIEKIVEKGRFPEAHARGIFVQLLDAIRYLHDELKCSHRDLKPDNIMLKKIVEKRGKRYVVKLTDFGVARFFGGGASMQTLAGTPRYLAPELLAVSGEGWFPYAGAGGPEEEEGEGGGGEGASSMPGSERDGYGKEVDMWSLGVILYLLLSGDLPFQEAPMAIAMDLRREWRGGASGGAVAKHPPGWHAPLERGEWGGISAEAKDLVGKLLAIRPEERISAAQAQQHPWVTGTARGGGGRKTVTRTRSEMEDAEEKVEDVLDDDLIAIPSPKRQRR